MVEVRSRLSDTQVATLTALTKINISDLQAISSELSAAPFTVDPDDVRERIERIAGSEPGRQLHSFLFTLLASVRSDDQSPEATLANVGAQVKTALPSLAEGWEPREAIFKAILGSRSVRTSAKAIQVSYDFERVFLEGRFITSIRPIFDDPRETILGAAVVQTLRIDYSSAGGEQASISFACDRADIEQLYKSCELALKKGNEALRQAHDAWRLPVMMPGGR